ncbi:MAG: hypothetical protein J6U54_20990 [Clostridiales bacterium]|nr:hypothetical protein [Clostridiales bacterium]
MEKTRRILSKVPIIAFVLIALSWIVYFVYPKEHVSIEILPHSYWSTMELLCIFLFVNFAIFAVSFIFYLIFKPIHSKRKWLRVVLRIAIGILALSIVFMLTWVSVFIFSGGGY